MSTSVVPASRASVLLNRLLARTRLRQLQLLVLVADLGSIRRAAAQVGLTQPSATKAVAELEQLVGQPLFERHARGARPTFACRDMLPLLRHMLASLNGCAETLAAAAEGVQGVIRVGAITGSISGPLGRALPAFMARHEQLRVEVVEDARHVLHARFAERMLDLVLVREPSPPIGGARFVPLLADRVVVVAGPGHPLQRRRELRPEQLLGQTWVQPPLDALMHGVLERLFEPCGRMPAHMPLITRSQPMLLQFLRESQALSLTPLSFVQSFVEAGLLQVLKLRGADVLPPIGMLVPEAPAKRGVSLLSEFFERWASPV